MSTSGPGARPSLHHNGAALCVITHAKPLCLSFCTEALLTIITGVMVAICWYRVLVEWALQSDLYNTCFHGGRREQNCCCNIFYFTVVSVGRGSVGVILITGRRICPNVGSVGVTGGPSKVNIVGTIEENLTTVRHVRAGRATCIGAIGVCQ